MLLRKEIINKMNKLSLKLYNTESDDLKKHLTKC